ncbi:MAG: universal stress protein [Planctomycetes bacterium]|nr:universal stress protein [Planctomycetota bacterium]
MFSRVLLATDFSEHSEQAYPWAAQLAASNQGTVVLIHVLEGDLVAHAPLFAGYMQTDALDMGRYREEFEKAAQTALDASAEKIRALGAEVETHFVQGKRASETLVRSAENLNCNVIVISTHGRGGLAKFLLGSTAEKVVRIARCPVFTIHLEDPVLQGD